MSSPQHGTPALPTADRPASSPLELALSPAALIVGNLVPLFGVLLWDWDAAALVIFYWSENLVVGAITVLKMLHRNPLTGLFSSAFFAVHYGGFCAVHGLFVMLFFGFDMDGALSDMNWPFALVFVELLIGVVRQVLAQAPPEWLWGFAALAASHGVSFVVNYLWRGEHEQATLQRLMGAPYGRIVVLHIAVLAGGFAVAALGSPLPILMVLVIGKIVLDLTLHAREHNFTLTAWHHAVRQLASRA